MFYSFASTVLIWVVQPVAAIVLRKCFSILAKIQSSTWKLSFFSYNIFWPQKLIFGSLIEIYTIRTSFNYLYFGNNSLICIKPKVVSYHANRSIRKRFNKIGFFTKSRKVFKEPNISEACSTESWTLFIVLVFCLFIFSIFFKTFSASS